MDQSVRHTRPFCFTSRVQYQYDHLNQLVRRVTDADGAGAAPAAQTVYVFDRGQVLLQFDGAGDAPLAAEDLSHRYLWGPMVDELLADEGVAWTDANRDGADDAASPHDTLWALADHLGTVRDLVDDAGVVRNHKSYDAFGRVTAETNAARDVAFGFTGKLLDDTTGLQNNLHRWYDAGLGAWVSEDPIGFAAGDANLGRYVANAPTMATDPDGLEQIPGGIPPGFAKWLDGNGPQPPGVTHQQLEWYAEKDRQAIESNREFIIHTPRPERIQNYVNNIVTQQQRLRTVNRELTKRVIVGALIRLVRMPFVLMHLDGLDTNGDGIPDSCQGREVPI